MKYRDFIELMEEIAPTEDYREIDNSGPQIVSGAGDVRKVLVCLEINMDVIREAEEKILQELGINVRVKPFTLRSIGGKDFFVNELEDGTAEIVEYLSDLHPLWNLANAFLCDSAEPPSLFAMSFQLLLSMHRKFSNTL